MKRKAMLFSGLAIILLLVSIFVIFFVPRIYAQKGPLLKKGEIKGFYLDTERIDLEKDEDGTSIYSEYWYSVKPEIYHEKSGIDSKTGKLKEFDFHYIHIHVITFHNKKPAKEYFESKLIPTDEKRGRWREGSYLGKVYGDRTICFRDKEEKPDVLKFISILKGKNVIEISCGGTIRGKYPTAEFAENIAKIIEKRVK